jgi:peptidoglycan L-alanyl-D-glutamate endopeptidase CwlK
MILSPASEKKLVGVKPALVKVARRAAEISKQPFQVVQGKRTPAEQRALYAQGRTKPGPKVTWTMNSRHLGGNAIDYAALVNGKISWNAKLYPAIAKAFKQAAKELKTPIIWGGDWKAKDWGHIQLA